MEEQYQQKSYSWKKYSKIIGGVILGCAFLFCLLILILRWFNPPFTAFTLQENWNELGQERYSLRENWIHADKLPDHLKLAVVASEDQRFYSHWGLDLAAIDKALEEKEQNGRVRGASTITQQVAKNLFLSPAQNYFRKGIEAGIAVLIEFFWPKDRILEMYFNIAEFGPGMFGVNRASEFYYGKPASRLNPKESARMATVLPNPDLIEPEPPSEYVLERSQWILRNMEQLSGLSYLPKPEPEALPDSIEILLDSLRTLDSIPNLQTADSLFPTVLDSIRRF
ncbi:MAG: monofunctional biosynthetic peptidoglycan transglycosylase [Gracilimonas sp.]|nr:monofunctional biosynthetic peptidoglycan transglycosylase [Gracilimonas sp.]